MLTESCRKVAGKRPQTIVKMNVKRNIRYRGIKGESSSRWQVTGCKIQDTVCSW